MWLAYALNAKNLLLHGQKRPASEHISDYFSILGSWEILNMLFQQWHILTIYISD